MKIKFHTSSLLILPCKSFTYLSTISCCWNKVGILAGSWTVHLLSFVPVHNWHQMIWLEYFLTPEKKIMTSANNFRKRNLPTPMLCFSGRVSLTCQVWSYPYYVLPKKKTELGSTAWIPSSLHVFCYSTWPTHAQPGQRVYYIIHNTLTLSCINTSVFELALSWLT